MPLNLNGLKDELSSHLKKNLGLIGLIGSIASVVSVILLFNSNITYIVCALIVWLFIYIMICLIQSIRQTTIRNKYTVFVDAFPNWNTAPEKYKIHSFLSESYDKHHIEIVARTCFRWLCGNEKLLKEDKQLFLNQKSQLQRIIVNTFNKNTDYSIRMVLQCPKIDMPWWEADGSKIERNRKHFEIALQSYIDIKEELKLDKDRFVLSITDIAVPNSMTRVSVCREMAENNIVSEASKNSLIDNNRRQIRILIADLSDPFFMASGLEKSERLIKPFVIFFTELGEIHEYETKFQTYSKNIADCFGCDCKCKAKEIIP